MSETEPDLDKTVSLTQKTLGRHVKRPPLTAKLLKKPPFRFLHDVVVSVIREHGFLRGLFTEAELSADNVKERDAKIAFLTKLIDATKGITKKPLNARPNKIVAGLEPEETNRLLQAIGAALSSKLDSREYVRSVTSKEKLKQPASNNTRKPKADKPKKPEEKPRTSSRKPEPDKPRKHPKPQPQPQPQPNNSPKVDAVSDEPPTVAEEASVPIVRDRSERPKSARPRSGDFKRPPSAKHVEAELDSPLQPKPAAADYPSLNSASEAVEAPETAKPDDALPASPPLEDSRPKTTRGGGYKNANEAPPSRPKSSLRPPSVRPSSARPGAPRLRPDSALPVAELLPMGKIKVIVENYSGRPGDEEEDEEETVVVQSGALDPVFLDPDPAQDLPADRGHLVDQILEQIGDGDARQHAPPRRPVDLNWEREGMRNVVKEVGELRGGIQALTGAANPLGKLLSYMQEDVDTMDHELAAWTSSRRQIAKEIDRQNRLNEEAIKPMENQLRELNDNIDKQRQEIRLVRANILKNDARILQLTERLLY